VFDGEAGGTLYIGSEAGRRPVGVMVGCLNGHGRY
jgi:hypothetical protein